MSGDIHNKDIALLASEKIHTLRMSFRKSGVDKDFCDAYCKIFDCCDEAFALKPDPEFIGKGMYLLGLSLNVLTEAIKPDGFDRPKFDLFKKLHNELKEHVKEAYGNRTD